MSAGQIWGPVAGAVVGAVTVGAVGRWFTVPSRLRRLQLMKVEADLLQVIPGGPSRDALQEKLEVDVLQHLDLERNRKYAQWTGILRSVRVVQAIPILGGPVAVTYMKGAEWWVVVASFALELLATTANAAVVKKLRAISQESQDQAVEQVAAGGAAQMRFTAGSSDPPRVGGEAHIHLGGDQV